MPIFIFQPSSLPLWHPDVSSGIHKDSPEGIWRCAWVVDQEVMEENSGPDASPMQVTFFTARTPGRSQYMQVDLDCLLVRRTIFAGWQGYSLLVIALLAEASGSENHPRLFAPERT